jgi:hypothetical protein
MNLLVRRGGHGLQRHAAEDGGRDAHHADEGATEVSGVRKRMRVGGGGHVDARREVEHRVPQVAPAPVADHRDPEPLGEQVRQPSGRKTDRARQLRDSFHHRGIPIQPSGDALDARIERPGRQRFQQTAQYGRRCPQRTGRAVQQPRCERFGLGCRPPTSGSLLMGGERTAEQALRFDEHQGHPAVTGMHRMPLVGPHHQHRSAQPTADGAVDPHISLQGDDQLEGMVGVQRGIAALTDEQSAVAVIEKDPSRPGTARRR